MDGWDVDLPTRLEASYVCNLVAKLLWATAYIAVYGLRPIIIKPKPIGASPAPLLCRVVERGQSAGLGSCWAKGVVCHSCLCWKVLPGQVLAVSACLAVRVPLRTDAGDLARFEPPDRLRCDGAAGGGRQRGCFCC